MELLIVIGVLGILAAGLLAAIDPFEQLKKARDTNNRSAALELVSSFTRYYANHGAFPWNMTAPVANCSRVAQGALEGLLAKEDGALSATADPMKQCIKDTLIVDGELKTTFFDGVGSTTIYVGSAPAATDKTNVEVCFSPEGKSSRTDPATKYLYAAGKITDQSELETPACPNVATSNCLQCFK